MSTEAGDKLDLLIAFAARDCGNDDVEMFRELDTSGVTLSDSFYAGQRRRSHRRGYIVVCRRSAHEG